MPLQFLDLSPIFVNDLIPIMNLSLYNEETPNLFAIYDWDDEKPATYQYSIHLHFPLIPHTSSSQFQQKYGDEIWFHFLKSSA